MNVVVCCLLPSSNLLQATPLVGHTLFLVWCVASSGCGCGGGGVVWCGESPRRPPLLPQQLLGHCLGKGRDHTGGMFPELAQGSGCVFPDNAVSMLKTLPRLRAPLSQECMAVNSGVVHSSTPSHWILRSRQSSSAHGKDRRKISLYRKNQRNL